MTQYMPILATHNGEEYGILFLGDRNRKFQSIFPSTLFSYQQIHNTYLEALEYLESIWLKTTNKQEQNAFYIEMVRQREHELSAEHYAVC